MLVYRIEHTEQNMGPYSISGMWTKYKVNLYEVMRQHSYAQSDPFHDPKLETWCDLPEQREYCFGFESLEDLNIWFRVDIEREAFIKCEFVIRVFETADAYIGKGQLVFHRETATLIDTLPLYRLLPVRIAA